MVISLQSDILQALQIARAVESAVLDLTTLHESSITNRKDAIRSMDELCRRVMANQPPYGYYGSDGYDHRNSSSSSPRPQYNFSQMERAISDDAGSFRTVTMSGYPAGVSIPGQASDQQMSFQRAQSTRQGNDMIAQRAMSQSSHGPSPSWSATQPRRRDSDMPLRRTVPVPEGEENETRKVRDHPDLDRMSELSLQDSAIGSDIGSHRRPAGSINSIAQSDHPRASSVSDQSTSEQPKDVQKGTPPSMRNPSVASNAKPVPNEEDDLTPDSSEQASLSSRTASPAASRHSRSETASMSSRLETAEDMSRAMYAPEVVTKEFESLLSQQSGRPSPRHMRPDQLSNVHPALRVPHSYVDMPASPEPDNAWAPLPRPAKHNSYHGFCKGAWQIRKSVRMKTRKNFEVESLLTLFTTSRFTKVSASK